MSKLNFADRYAEAGLAPGGAIIAARQAPANRILESLTVPRIFDLVQLYFGQLNLDLNWLRDEFIQEDPAFSLVNNQRECVVLATTILGARVAEGDSQTILALLTTSASGKRSTAEFDWLLDEAKAGLLRHAVSARQPRAIEPTLKLPTTHQKLGDEIAAIAANDWQGLINNLGKIRAQATEGSQAIATQASAALKAVASQLKFMREETQMLWWLFSEHSRTLNRHFSLLSPGLAAIVAGVDLGDLTTASVFGPVAAPAMLERVLRLARKEQTKKTSLTAVLDDAPVADLQALTIFGKDQPPCVFPMMTAIDRARANPGSWHKEFEKSTGIDATTEFEPIELATQTYYEHLLGQLL
ncbi:MULTISPECIES: GTPase-associated system all-helical protein GASH [unclassified Bradyrhizobium]|uniref:GTPase-associated system all-helical protein GASH n=1 Tax=unclassified Bradyrhizobium TaxID=2631580 RepID=UPI0028E1AB1E|nr:MULTISPECIES: GTPase-associated system all-helical protein GASH [unclassified Bradyrhizobium]